MDGRREVVVVGVDGSEAAEAAVRWAFDEAERLGADLEVVCAWDYPEASAPFLLGGTAVYDAAAADAHASVHAVVDRLRAEHPDSPVEVRPVSLAGPPAVALVRRADDAALLVVGTRGRGGLRSLLLGSVSRQCCAQARCPVVVVRRGRTGPHAVRSEAVTT